MSGKNRNSRDHKDQGRKPRSEGPKYGRDALIYPPRPMVIKTDEGVLMDVRLVVQEKGEGKIVASTMGRGPRRYDHYPLGKVVPFLVNDTEGMANANRGMFRVTATPDGMFHFTGFCRKIPNSGGKPEIKGDCDLRFHLPLSVVRAITQIADAMCKTRDTMGDKMAEVMDYFDGLKPKRESRDEDEAKAKPEESPDNGESKDEAKPEEPSVAATA